MTGARIPLTNAGLIPAGVDVDHAIVHGSDEVLLAVHATYRAQRHRGASHTDDPDYARVSPLQALAANRRLDELLTAERSLLISDARDNGDSWTRIGEALGLTKQGAADWWRRNTAAVDDPEARRG